MKFCVASDSKHFPLLLNLIGSIHKLNFDDLEVIFVYDLGLDINQINQLENIQKLEIKNVEKTNSDILTNIQTDHHRWVKGLFSWKPVIIRDMLNYYDSFLYVDAGTTFLKPINNLFNHINENGYLFFDCGHSIKWMTTQYVIEKLNLQTENNLWLLDDVTHGIDAGFMGISKKIEKDFVDTMYEFSKDMKLFFDDGTCPNGWGTGRHDQTLFSIIAKKNNYNILIHDRDDIPSYLNFDDKKIKIHITHLSHRVNQETDIFRSRWNLNRQNVNNNVSNIKMK
jgi:hypothetical protein